MPGVAPFITLEGGEGAGKSTQIRLLEDALRACGVPCLVTREPGGSPGAEAIRALLVSGEAGRWQPQTEALLFMAARADHLAATVMPALEAGTWVLCDRFFDSTAIYQGLAKSVGVALLEQLYRLLYGTFAPALTLLLDLPPEIGLARAQARGSAGESRFESLGLAYHQRIREGFLARAAAEPGRFVRIDATAEPPVVHAEILAALRARFAIPGAAA